MQQHAANLKEVRKGYRRNWVRTPAYVYDMELYCAYFEALPICYLHVFVWVFEEKGSVIDRISLSGWHQFSFVMSAILVALVFSRSFVDRMVQVRNFFFGILDI